MNGEDGVDSLRVVRDVVLGGPSGYLYAVASGSNALNVLAPDDDRLVLQDTYRGEASTATNLDAPMAVVFDPNEHYLYVASAGDKALRVFAVESPAPCAGDCDNNGAVSIDELVRAVRVALGQEAVEVCAAVDQDSDDRVTVAELVGAVRGALRGCTE